MKLRLAIALAFTLALPAFAKELPFVEDDYAKAIKQARIKKVPLFVEAWAPW